MIRAALAIIQGNPGHAIAEIESVFNHRPTELWTTFYDDLLRLTRLFKQYDFAEFYLDWLYKQRFHIKLAPYVVAVEAFYRDKDELLRNSLEIRKEAEPMYQWLASST